MTNALTGALPARRGSRVPKSWQSKFIATLSETSNVAAAARAAKVSTSRVYQSRRESPEFAQLWFAALCDGYDALEMDLLYRLRTGKVEETDENGTKRKFDSATAFKCLLAHRETVSRENTPPAEPVEGQCWLIGAAPTGAWAGKAGQLACFQVGSWLYTAPRDGMQILDRATEQRISFMGTWKRPNAPLAPTGGTTVDAEARNAINDLIAGLVEAGILRAV